MHYIIRGLYGRAAAVSLNCWCTLSASAAKLLLLCCICWQSPLLLLHPYLCLLPSFSVPAYIFYICWWSSCRNLQLLVRCCPAAYTCTRPATAPADKVAACCWAWGLLLPHNFPQDYSLWWTKREPLAGIWTDVLIIIGFEISETSSAGSLRASLSLIMRTPVYPSDKGIWRTSLTHPKSPSLSVAGFQEWANTPSLNDVDFQKSDLQYSNLSK